MSNYCVILAGGSSTSFWPISREDRPKELVRSESTGKSFLMQTYNRMLGLFPAERIYIATLYRLKELIMEQLPQLGEEQLILEPYSRNTAPAIAFSTYKILAKDPDAVIVTAPTDQQIRNSEAFGEAIGKAIDYVSKYDVLLALGIVPTSPDTHFGYVQVEGGRDAYKAGVPIKARTFTEKPSAELARVFVESGEFLWNSGIFVGKASKIHEEMQVCCPEITMPWKGWQNYMGTPQESSFVERVYTDSPKISIDYAVLEKSGRLWVLPSLFDWSDVGDFNSLYENSPHKDGDGNLLSIAGKSLLKDVDSSIIWTNRPRKLTVVRGLKDFLVVDSDDVLYICPRDERILQDTQSELAAPDFDDYR